MAKVNEGGEHSLGAIEHFTIGSEGSVEWIGQTRHVPSDANGLADVRAEDGVGHAQRQTQTRISIQVADDFLRVTRMKIEGDVRFQSPTETMLGSSNGSTLRLM